MEEPHEVEPGTPDAAHAMPAAARPSTGRHGAGRDGIGAAWFERFVHVREHELITYASSVAPLHIQCSDLQRGAPRGEATPKNHMYDETRIMTRKGLGSRPTPMSTAAHHGWTTRPHPPRLPVGGAHRIKRLVIDVDEVEAAVLLLVVPIEVHRVLVGVGNEGDVLRALALERCREPRTSRTCRPRNRA